MSPKKSVALKKTVAKKAVVKKAPKKIITKKLVAKKPIVKKTVSKKLIAKKPIAKKVTVKKTAVKPVPQKPVTQKVAVKKPTDTPAAPQESAPHKPTLLEIIGTGPKGMPEQLLEAAMKVLDERQAEDITMVPLAGRSPIADYMVIASGRASRQVAAIADHLREAFFKLGVKQVRIEGQQEANWVLVDAGDVIIHLFRPEVRSYYDLDAIWKKSER